METKDRRLDSTLGERPGRNSILASARGRYPPSTKWMHMMLSSRKPAGWRLVGRSEATSSSKRVNATGYAMHSNAYRIPHDRPLLASHWDILAGSACRFACRHLRGGTRQPLATAVDDERRCEEVERLTFRVVIARGFGRVWAIRSFKLGQWGNITYGYGKFLWGCCWH